MEHNEIKELVILSAYNELDGYTAELVKNHLAACSECRELHSNELSLRAVVSGSLPGEPKDRLISDARLQLRAALRLENDKKLTPEKILNRIREFIYLNYKPILSGAVMLVIGFLLSLFVRLNSGGEGQAESLNPSDLLKSGIKINNIRVISSNQQTGEMEIEFDTQQSVKLSGSFDDENIQKVMMYSILNDENPGVRLRSIDLIDSKKERGIDKEVKAAILTAAQYDDNPGVRRSALKTVAGLTFDDDIKNALINIMSTDENAAFRIEALNILAENIKGEGKVDEALRNALKQRAENDDNSYMKFKAKSVLEERSI
ncbi:MAG: HEAT repeat domain-containing protein [Ignavibacteriaceae bacterium]|nr:HEAT repeat domain-containing protein [Ignavibacteriaceae bacterium]